MYVNVVCTSTNCELRWKEIQNKQKQTFVLDFLLLLTYFEEEAVTFNGSNTDRVRLKPCLARPGQTSLVLLLMQLLPVEPRGYRKRPYSTVHTLDCLLRAGVFRNKQQHLQSRILPAQSQSRVLGE